MTTLFSPYLNTLPRHPNVVVFLTDQQRHDDTGAHGNPLGVTPHFDRVAARRALDAAGEAAPLIELAPQQRIGPRSVLPEELNA